MEAQIRLDEGTVRPAGVDGAQVIDRPRGPTVRVRAPRHEPDDLKFERQPDNE